jgi:hypothetical protein
MKHGTARVVGFDEITTYRSRTHTTTGLSPNVCTPYRLCWETPVWEKVPNNESPLDDVQTAPKPTPSLAIAASVHAPWSETTFAGADNAAPDGPVTRDHTWFGGPSFVTEILISATGPRRSELS